MKREKEKTKKLDGKIIKIAENLVREKWTTFAIF